jgi:hypothetical protein
MQQSRWMYGNLEYHQHCEAIMAQADPKRNQLKLAVKEAFAEALQDQRELLRELLAEALEDVVLADAIRKGKKTKSATRNEVFRALNS